jgi:hypothetical protein
VAISDRVSWLEDAAIDTASEMFDKRTEDSAIQFRKSKVSVKSDMSRRHEGRSAGYPVEASIQWP